MKRLAACIAALLAPARPLLAQVGDSAPAAGLAAPPELFSAGYLAQVLGSLLLVFACLLAVIFLLRRLNRVGGNGGGALRVVGSASVGQREKIVLLDAGGQQLLIGVAPGSVRKLHVFAKPVVDMASRTTAPATDFAAVLSAANPLGGRS